MLSDTGFGVAIDVVGFDNKKGLSIRNNLAKMERTEWGEQ